MIFLVKLRRLGSGQPGARAGTASSPAGRVRIWGGTYFPATNMVDEMLGVFLKRSFLFLGFNYKIRFLERRT